MIGELALKDERTKSEFRPRSASQGSDHVDRVIRRAVARAKTGDQEALRVLYLRYSDNVYGYVRSIVRDHHDAEDITQHVFSKLMTVLVKYDQRSVPFLGWLLRLAHNASIDYLRTRRPVPAEEIYGPDARADEDATDRSITLNEALAALPDEQRNVVLMRHVRGLTPGEIAVQMGRSESSIHGLHHRGRRALKAELMRRDSAPSTASLSPA
jgi:RNA polymerase sigma-70 factor (ECF subfamily)